MREKEDKTEEKGGQNKSKRGNIKPKRVMKSKILLIVGRETIIIFEGWGRKKSGF